MMELVNLSKLTGTLRIGVNLVEIIINKDELINHVNWLIANIYVVCGDSMFKQVIGIPMGTDCAPFLANLFLFSYEYEWLTKK